ncbi:MAG: type II toxin-antitoxin system VapB family antitoxin [Actinomycetales bacterium]
MSLNIKNAEAERLARDLATALDLSVTGAVLLAVREKLQAVQRRGTLSRESRAELLMDLSRDAAGRWPESSREGDPAASLYDDRGVPA